MAGFDQARQWIGTLISILVLLVAGVIYGVRQEGRIDVLGARVETVASVRAELRTLVQRQSAMEAAQRELTASVRALTESLRRERDVSTSTLRATREEMSGRLARIEREVERLRARVNGTGAR